MRSSAAGRVGIAMILGGVFLYAGLKHWVDTRNFHPVNVPITLETGEIVEQKFAVNVGGEYWVDFEIPKYPWSNEAYQDTEHLHFQFEIRDSYGKEVPTYSWSAQPDGTVKGMATCVTNLKHGVYSAKLVMLNGSRPLSAFKPRLHIQTDRTFPDFLVVLSQWVAAFVIVAGLMLALRRAILSRRERAAEETAFTTPPTGSYPSSLILGLRERRQFATPSQWAIYSHWALYIVLFLVLLLMTQLVFTSFRLPVIGIWVRLLREVPPITAKQSPTPKLVLCVVCSRRERGYMIRERLLESGDLRSELKRELAQQLDWTVYVDGDSDCTFTEVMRAVDVARGLQAKVVLVTPETRALIDSDPQKPVLNKRPAIPTALQTQK